MDSRLDGPPVFDGAGRLDQPNEWSFDLTRYDAEMRALDARFGQVVQARAAREVAQATRHAVQRSELSLVRHRRARSSSESS